MKLFFITLLFFVLPLQSSAYRSLSYQGQYKPQANSLHKAVYKGDIEKVKLLIQEGADVNARAEKGDTPLHWIARDEDIAIAELLIKHGADVNIATTDSYHTKFYKGIFDILSGFTPLHLAIKRDSEKLASLLLKHGGADIEARDTIGRTPLFYANSYETTWILLEYYGADINAKDINGNTIYDEEKRKLNYDVILAIEDHVWRRSRSKRWDIIKPETNSLHEAVYKRDTEKVKLLIQEGADVNSIGEKGDTPLHWIVRPTSWLKTDNEKKIDKEIVELFIKQEFDINSATTESFEVWFGWKSFYILYGTTVLHLAVRKDDEELVSLLLENKANINARDSLGETPLFKIKSLKMAELLISAGADVNSKNIDGKTLLHRLPIEEELKLAKLLIKHGADVNAKDNLGYIVLHYRIDVETAGFLIENGADVNAITTMYSQTPCDQISKSEKDIDLKKLVIEKGGKCTPLAFKVIDSIANFKYIAQGIKLYFFPEPPPTPTY